MKKTRLFLLGCLIMVIGLTICSSTFSASDFANGKFKTTKHITVEVFDRSNPGGSKPDDNFYTNFIKAGMLRDHNVDVTFKTVPRWTEVDVLNNRLAAGEAPDVCVTYSYPTIQTYADMGGVIDLAPYLEKNKKLLKNLYGFVGEANITWDQDPVKKTIWAIEAKLAVNKRINTFVREDWLNKLGLKEPKTIKEFENVIRAFKANASKLLGADAAKMIPFSISYDVGWRANYLLTSFVPDKISDRDVYVYGFDDRQMLLPGIKEGVRKLNQWYNEGLIWPDFPLYGPGDKTEDNMIKAGYVGAFEHNWDYPYRADPGIHQSRLKRVGPDAAFIAVDCFKDNAGKYRKFLSAPVDRKIFFPASNKEPLASLLYLDWITKFENRKFLQIGEEGATHQVLEDGTIKSIAAMGEKIMNSPSNIDYTITCNGLDFNDPKLTAKSVALSYANVDARFIQKAFVTTDNDARYGKHVSVGTIKSEEGMGPALQKKRDNLLDQSIVAKPEDFDKVWDAGFKDYLTSGGQAIIDERAAAYEKFYGKK
ncbi:MAG TPA: extracellular solute-binding protein [Bacillota bacterium]|nr:extracellular solute-binding protein [Bacillota bacterium]